MLSLQLLPHDSLTSLYWSSNLRVCLRYVASVVLKVGRSSGPGSSFPSDQNRLEVSCTPHCRLGEDPAEKRSSPGCIATCL